VAPVAPPVLPARLAQAPAAAKPLDDPATLKRTPAASAPAQADTPRATCGSRTNFSLVYCMETQCKRPKFAQHPQCTAMRLRGEIN
jgi:hypothetical protein